MAATAKTRPDQSLHEAIELDRSQAMPDSATLVDIRNYADGIQGTSTKLTDGQKSVLAGILGHEFADNVCHQILSEDADRMILQRFQCDDDPDVHEWLDAFWTRSALDDLAGETHYEAVKDGNFCLSLYWDADQERVTVHKEPWWNGSVGVFIMYDAQGVPLYAVKDWSTPEGFRRVVWYEDRIERYVKERQAPGALWIPYALPSDPATGPQAWLKDNGDPLHIPVIHFANGGRGRKVYGKSELAGGVLAFQDQINDIQFDLSGAGRMTAFQMGYSSGFTMPKDDTGQPISAKVGPGEWFHSPSENARFGVLPAGDLSQLLSVYDAKLKSVCRMTRTPYYAITGGDWPSGEALREAMRPLLQKVRKQTAKFRPAWQTLAHRATEISNTFGRTDLSEDAMIDAIYEAADKRDPLTEALADKGFWDAALSAVQAGLPLEAFLRKAGWTDTDLQLLGTQRLAAIKLKQEDTVGQRQ